MSELAALFQSLTQAQRCLPHPVPWPDGLLAQAGLSSRSAQAYGRLWALQGALATTIQASLAASGGVPSARQGLPLSRWRECATWLATALDLAKVHAASRDHVFLLDALRQSGATLGVLQAQLCHLENGCASC